MTDDILKPNKLIAVYGRVSTSNQENEGTIETQLSAVREYASKNNLTIVQEYLDNGWSGDNIVRPALDQLRLDAKRNVWDAVLMYDPDRLARRYSYQELITDELLEAKIEVLFVTTPPPKDGTDKLLHGVKGLFAEYERTKISERFRIGKLRKVKEGNILTTEAPYGYAYIRGNRELKQHGYYKINEEEAKVVNMIFNWIGNEGSNIRRVVLQLQELGIMPRKSKRGVWNTSTLTTMLRNETYIGLGHWGSSYSVVPENPLKIEKYRKMKKTSRRMKPKEDWIASAIPVPAILDKDLFYRTRAQLKKNSELSSRNQKHHYLLSGKIYCACSRRGVGVGQQGGKYLYYRCTDKIYSFPLPSTCQEKGFNARIADTLVWNKIAELMSSPKLMAQQVSRWMNSRKKESQTASVDIQTIEKEMSKLKIKEERYNKAYGDGVFTIDQLKEYLAPMRHRMNNLEIQRTSARQQDIKTDSMVAPSQDEIVAFTLRATKALYNLDYEAKRKIILNTVDKVIGTQQKLEVYGFVPLTETNVALSAEYRNRGVAERG